MAGYTDWLFGEQHGSRCWRCTLAMWVARYVVAGDPGEAVAVGSIQALFWIWSNWSHMVVTPSGCLLMCCGG